ncbi:MAG: hypothetical protein ACLFTH_00080 [Candidatus Woesearchaeota archaeon]
MKATVKDDTKGQIQLQFNWIFVIIIGAVLLGFFFSLTGTQTDVAEKSITSSTARQLETIITSTAQKSGTFKKYTEIPQRELSFHCDSSNGIYHYEISNIRAGTTKHDILFSPKRFTPENIYTWTLDWTVPYKMTTFTYLTHDDHAFVFYDDKGDNFKMLYKPFPKNMTHVIYNESTKQGFSIEELNYDDYTFVFFEDQNIPDDLKNKIRGESSLVIKIEPEKTDIFSYGTVSFIPGDDYASDSEGEKAPYFGKASLYGAMFSGSKQLYQCTMDKAYSYMHMVTLMQLDRVEHIIPRVKPACQRLLGGVDDGIPRAKHHLNNISTIVNSSIDTSSDVENLYKYTREIEDSNHRLSMEGSCPLIY